MNTRKTTINQVSYLSVGQKGENKRLWLEGKKMDVSGFAKGQIYKTVLDVQTKSVTLILDDDGDKKVSGRQRNGQVRPIMRCIRRWIQGRGSEKTCTFVNKFVIISTCFYGEL